MDSYAAALQECFSTSKVIVLSEGSEKSKVEQKGVP